MHLSFETRTHAKGLFSNVRFREVAFRNSFHSAMCKVLAAFPFLIWMTMSAGDSASSGYVEEQKGKPDAK